MVCLTLCTENSPHGGELLLCGLFVYKYEYRS